MNGARGLRVGLKVLHEVASIGIGGGLCACLVIDLTVSDTNGAAFLFAREAIAAIAKYILLPSMAIAVVSGLLAIAATRGYHDAGWAWVKALLGLSVFEATLVTVGASRDRADLAAAAVDPAQLAALLHAERNTLWLLIVLCAANVVLAVWRPKLMVKIR